MSSVKTTSFLLHSLHRDLSSAVLSLEGHSPGGTDCILERKRSTKSPRREFHACLLQECPTWDTVEQLQISQGYFRLLSDFREDVLSHLSEWKLGPLPSMLMQAGKLSSVQEIPLFTFPCLLPRVQSTQRKQEYYISIKAELKYSCISFSLSRTSGQSESQVQAQGLHQGFPLHPPQLNSSQLCKGFYIELPFQPQINLVTFRVFC